MQSEWAFSPLVGAADLQQYEQDFCEGAKGLNSLYPPISPFSCSGFSDDWPSYNDPLSCGTLEVFNDVILDEDKNSVEQYNRYEYTSPEHHISSPETDIPFAVSPLMYNEELDLKIRTIKLKRVKCERKTPKKKHLKYGTDSPYPVDIFDSELSGYGFTPSQLDIRSSLSSDIEDDPRFSLGNDSIGTSSPPTTLKDIMSAGDADNLLECYMSAPTATSPSSDATCELSQGIFGDVQNYSSRDTDTLPSIANSEASSPISSEELESFFASSPNITFSPSPEYFISSPEISLSSPPESDPISSESKKSKTGRQKMSAENRYLRKKEQNKLAAIRYRAKKKRESEDIQSNMNSEEKRRKELENKYTTLKQEVSFMKKLMREVCISKNLVPPNAFDSIM